MYSEAVCIKIDNTAVSEGEIKGRWWDHNQSVFIYFSVLSSPGSAVITKVEQGSCLVGLSDSTEKLAKLINNLPEIERRK